jgi:DNA transformation protein and related proteins
MRTSLLNDQSRLPRSPKSGHTPLRGLVNIGPAIADRLEQAGAVTAGDLRSIGVAEVYRRLAAARAGKTVPVCYYLYSLQGALDGVHWNDLPAATKRRLLKQIGR